MVWSLFFFFCASESVETGWSSLLLCFMVLCVRFTNNSHLSLGFYFFKESVDAVNGKNIWHLSVLGSVKTGVHSFNTSITENKTCVNSFIWGDGLIGWSLYMLGCSFSNITNTSPEDLISVSRFCELPMY